MPISHMEHFLLQTEDIEATKDWYVKILGFRVGPAPDFKFPVYWLYLADRDVLHITTGGKNVSDNRKKYVGQQSEAATGTGVIAFSPLAQGVLTDKYLEGSVPAGSRAAELRGERWLADQLSDARRETLRGNWARNARFGWNKSRHSTSPSHGNAHARHKLRHAVAPQAKPSCPRALIDYFMRQP